MLLYLYVIDVFLVLFHLSKLLINLFFCTGRSFVVLTLLTQWCLWRAARPSHIVTEIWIIYSSEPVPSPRGGL